MILFVFSTFRQFWRKMREPSHKHWAFLWSGSRAYRYDKCVRAPKSNNTKIYFESGLPNNNNRKRKISDSCLARHWHLYYVRNHRRPMHIVHTTGSQMRFEYGDGTARIHQFRRISWICIYIAFLGFHGFPVQTIAALNTTGSNLSDVAGVKGALLLVWNQTKSVFCPPNLFNMLMMCGSYFALFFVIHGQQFWYPQILSYYSVNINMSLTICEMISLGHLAELNATRNAIYMMNR